jgi:HAMP domain-containing protein/two-component sensor histidine kinase
MLIFLLSLPIITIITYFFLTTKIFEKDKIAYSFDQGLVQLELISDVLDIELGIQKKLQEIYSLYNVNPSHRPSEFITFSDKYLDIARINLETTKSSFVDSISGDLKKSDSQLLLSAIQTISDGGELLVQGENLVFFFITHSGKRIYTVSKFSSVPLSKIFSDEANSKVKVLNPSFRNFLYSNQSSGPDRISSKLRDFSSSGLDNGTLEFDHNDGKKDLISFKRNKSGNWILVTYDKSLTLDAVNYLKKQTTYYLIIFISLAIIASVYGTSRLTRSILSIYDATKEVAKGNYNIKLPIKSRDEVQTLALSFESMASNISNLLNQLKEYSEHLEDLVRQRTAELSYTTQLQKSMLESLGQGFVIVDKNLQILPAYSKAASIMFPGISSGAKAISLTHDMGVPAEDFESFFNELFQNSLPFKDIVDLMPQKFRSSSGQFIELKYFPFILEDSEELKGVVLVATDKTSEMLSNQALEEEKNRVKMISRFFSHRDQFTQFLKDVATLKNSFTSNPSKDEAKFILHTLKGSAGFFGLVTFRKDLHQLEESLIQEIMIDISTGINFAVENLMAELNSNFKFLQIDFLGKRKIKEIDVYLIENFSKSIPFSSLNELKIYFDKNFLFTHVRKHLSYLSDLTDELARTQGKLLRPLRFEGKDVYVKDMVFDEFFLSLSHLIRNSIIHGIEDLFERRQVGKSEEGEILISYDFQDSDYFTISFQDDGRGLDQEKLIAKLEELQLKPKVNSSQDLYEVMIDAGISLSDSVGLEAGRGAGIGAVKKIVQNFGGKFEINSHPGLSFIVKMSLPIHHRKEAYFIL